MHERILILSSKFGEGHYQAGQAVASVLESRLSSKVVVKHLDFGSFFFRRTDYLMRKAYFNMVTKTPELWKFIYEKTAEITAESCRKIVNGLGSKNLLSFIREFHPDVIVNTHFISAGLLAEYKKKGLINTPLVTVVTDYLVHGVWIHTGVDLYLVGCKAAISTLIDRGIPPEKIILTGIPVRPCFNVPLSQNDARKSLQLEQDKKTVLIMGGFGGISGKNPDIIDFLEDMSGNHSVQFLVVCGNDEDLYHSLLLKTGKIGVKANLYRYREDIQELMAAADILITKGGALTISEALTLGLPLLIYKPIPGHENGNALFIEQTGAGIRAHTPQELQSLAKELLSNPIRLQEMRLAAKRAIPENTALVTAKSILGLANNGKPKEYENQAII
ncbi:MAG: glycosyltransferase [Peptococcaceae bacterium]|nr:glycosyltransferase [Peptococcaceae bacterium]